MRNPGRKVLANTLMLLAIAGHAAAQGAEPRFLPFAEELRRARTAIGPDAECRVIVEEVLARCELRAGGHAIQIHFADVPNGMLPRKSLTLAGAVSRLNNSALSSPPTGYRQKSAFRA